jgi:hypothetical protein
MPAGTDRTAQAPRQSRVAGANRQMINSYLQIAGLSCGKLPVSSRSEVFSGGFQQNNFQRLWMHLLCRSSPLQAGGLQTKTPDRLKVEGSMVSKCANPACSTPFHYLREGKIFKLEVEVTPWGTLEDALEFSDGNQGPFLVTSRKPVRKLEHFWLCGPCSQTMSLLFDKDNVVTVMRKPHVRAAAAAAAS